MEKTLKTLLMLLIGVMSMSLAACSDSDDELQSDGEKALAELNERLYVDGQFRFPQQAPDGQFYGYTDDKAEAKAKAEAMLGHELVNDAYTLTLPDNYGMVKVTPSEDATIYYTMYISVKGEEPKTCNIVDLAWYEDNAFSTLLTFAPEKLL